MDQKERDVQKARVKERHHPYCSCEDCVMRYKAFLHRSTATQTALQALRKAIATEFIAFLREHGDSSVLRNLDETWIKAFVEEETKGR